MKKRRNYLAFSTNEDHRGEWEKGGIILVIMQLIKVRGGGRGKGERIVD